MVSRSSSCSSSKSRERYSEKKIPVLSVFQNCSIIKNIFVVGPSDGGDDSSSTGKLPERDGGAATEMEEVVTVGRHPDNLIVLTHPSISRFHFKIVVKSSTHQLFVTDLDSAHGTWVSGKKIEPGVRIEVVEGDTIQIGASTRVYRLHWVPMSRADDMQDPSASSAMDVALVEEKAEQKPGLVEAKQTMTTPQKEDKELRVRDLDEVREVLSGKMDDGVALRAASEEFSRVSESSEPCSCEEVSGMEDEVIKLDSLLAVMEMEVKSESPLPVLAAEIEKENAEVQCRGSEEVFSKEKGEEVVLEAICKELSSQDESRECYSCEVVSDVQDSLDSSLAVMEEQEKSGCHVVEDAENQRLVKEDRAQCGMFKLESVNLSLTEGKPTESSEQVLFAEGKEEIGSPNRKDHEALEVSELGIDSPVIRHEEAPLRSLIEDQEQQEVAALGSDSGNLCYIAGNLAEADLQQVSLCEEKEEARVPLRNDNEMTEVSNYETCGSVAVGSEFEDNEVSESCFANDALAGGGNTDLSVIFEGEPSDVANLYSSLLFAAVKVHLDREIALMKDREPSESARLEVNLSMTVENLLEADQPLVSLEEGKDEIRSPSRNDAEVMEVPAVQEDFVDCVIPSMKDQKSDSVNSSMMDENLSGTEWQQVSLVEGKEEDISSSCRNDDEGKEVPAVQEDFVDCVSSSMKDQKLDSVNSSLMDDNLSGMELQQVSLVVGKEENISSLCRNDDEGNEVSNLPLSVENLLDADLLFFSFEGKYEISSLSINDGEVPEVPKSSYSVENLLENDIQLISFEGIDELSSLSINDGEVTEVAKSPFPVENLLEAELQLVSFEGKDELSSRSINVGEVTEVAKSAFPIENLLEAELQLVSFEGKDEMSSLSRNDSEVREVQTVDLTDLGYGERSIMKDEEHVEIGPSAADSGNLSLMLENLSEAEFQQSFVGKEDLGRSPITDDDNEEVAELPNSATGILADVESENGSEHVKFDELNRSPDSPASLRIDHGSAHLDSEGGSKDVKADELCRSPQSPGSLRSDHEKLDELNSGPESPASLRSDHGSADLESEGGSKHEKFNELDRSPESPASLKIDNGSDNVEFSELTRSPDWPSVEGRSPARLNTEFPACLETEISMDDFVSLMSVETMDGDDLDINRPLEEDHLGISSLETDSMKFSEASLQPVSFSEARDDQLMEAFEEAGSLVVLEAGKEGTFEEASPKSANLETESPLRSHLKVSNAMDLDTLFVAAVESDLNSNASPAEDQRQIHLDMSLFDSPAREEAISERGRSLSSSSPLDFGSSTPCADAAVRDQEQKMEQLCPVESESLTSPSQPVNNVCGGIQEPEDHSSAPNGKPGNFSVRTVSMVTESVRSSSFSIEELLSEIMESEEEESTTPQSVLAALKSLEQHPKSENNASRSSVKRTSFWLKRVESGSGVGQLWKCQSRGKISSEERRSTPKKLPFSGLGSPSQEDIFTPDKENRSPNRASSRRSVSSKITLTSRIMAEGDIVNTSPNKNSTPEPIQQRVATTPSSSSRNNKAKLGLEVVLRNDRMPLQNLIIRSPVRSSSGGGSSSLRSAASVETTPGSSALEQSSVNCSRGGTKTQKWIMVVDTASLLDIESRKALQLLQGLRGTRLIIPRIVKNELESLKRTGRLFRRKTEASKVLEWIEECGLKTEWWIHFQSSVDETPLPATPPASPESGAAAGSSRTKWYTPPFSYMTPPASPESGTTSKTRWYSAFSSMASPRHEDHVFSSALFYKKLCRDRERAVLISHDPDLLVKAMAKGLICETAQEFRASLVNPFSERFLWGESSPRGQTWSVHDDVVLKERYYPTPHRKLTRGENAQGLKLVLLDDDDDDRRHGFPSDSIKTL